MKRLPSMLRDHSTVLQAVATKAGVIAMNAATGLITARVLQPAGRGSLAAMIVLPGFLASLAVAGLPCSLVYHLKLDPRDRNNTLGAAVAMGLALGVLAGTFGCLIAPWWLSQYPAALVRSAQCFMLFAPVSALLLVGRAAFEANGDFSSSNLVSWMTPFPTLIILIALAALHSLTPFSAALAYLGGGVPVFAWMIVRLLGKYNPAASFHYRHIRRLTRYAIRSYGIDLVTTLIFLMDQVFVVRLLTPALAGVYIVTVNLARTLTVFSGSATMILLPQIAARPQPEVIAATGRSLRLTMGTTVLSYVALLLVGPLLLVYLYGPGYRAGASVLPLLALEVLIAGAIQVLAQAFLASGHPTTIAAIQIGGISLSVVLMLILAPSFGLPGIGAALLTATTLRLICTLVFLSRTLKADPFSLIFSKPRRTLPEPEPALVED